MKQSFVLTPIALAVTVLLCASAFAEDKSSSAKQPNQQSPNSSPAPKAASSQAVVGGQQIQNGNAVVNEIVDNVVTINGNAMKNVKGNVGVNAAAGSNNQQANDGALSVVDAQFVFATARTASEQKNTSVQTHSLATQNNARLSGSALAGAQGNIGANIAAGNSNQQRNELAVAVGKSNAGAHASSSGVQESSNNSTTSVGQLLSLTTETNVTLKGDLTGSYGGTGTIGGGGNGGGGNGGGGNGGNEIPPRVPGHVETGAVNALGNGEPLPVPIPNPNPNPTPVPHPDPCTSDKCDPTPTPGNSSFSEAGTVKLTGSFTGRVVNTTTAYRPHVNNASLGGKALQNAQGNIGVNIGAGSGNQQRNSLAISGAK